MGLIRLDLQETCHKRNFLKVKHLVRLFGGRCPTVLSDRPIESDFSHFHGKKGERKRILAICIAFWQNQNGFWHSALHFGRTETDSGILHCILPELDFPPLKLKNSQKILGQIISLLLLSAKSLRTPIKYNTLSVFVTLLLVTLLQTAFSMFRYVTHNGKIIDVLYLLINKVGDCSK